MIAEDWCGRGTLQNMDHQTRDGARSVSQAAKSSCLKDVHPDPANLEERINGKVEALAVALHDIKSRRGSRQESLAGGGELQRLGKVTLYLRAIVRWILHS
jgi:hypothetical protein